MLSARIDVVVHDEDAVPAKPPIGLGGLGGLLVPGVVADEQRQRDHELAALAQSFAERLDRAAVELHQLPDERQANAQARPCLRTSRASPA